MRENKRNKKIQLENYVPWCYFSQVCVGAVMKNIVHQQQSMTRKNTKKGGRGKKVDVQKIRREI